MKIWTTDFSGSEPSGSGVPCGGAEVAGWGATGGWAGAITAGSVLAGAGGVPGTGGLGATGVVAVPPVLPALAGGLITVVVAAWSDSGDKANARPIRQKPTQRRDNM